MRRGGLVLLVSSLLVIAPAAQAAPGDFEFAVGRDAIGGNANTGAEVCTVASQCRQSSRLGGELVTPSGIARDATNDHVFVINEGARRIERYDGAGTFQRAWGKDVDITGANGPEVCTIASNCKGGELGQRGGEFSNVMKGIAVDPISHDVIVTEGSNRRVQVFSENGTFVAAWGKDVVEGNAQTGYEVCSTPTSCKLGGSGSGNGDFSFPSGVASDGTSIYVSDQANNRIQKYTLASGAFTLAWGLGVAGGAGFQQCTTTCQASVAGAGNGGMNGPEGIGFDPDFNRLWVADTNNNRISAYNQSGVFIETVGKNVDQTAGTGQGEVCVPGTCQAGQFGAVQGGEIDQPHSIAIGDVTGPTNNLVFAGGNQVVERFTDTGNWQRRWGKAVDNATPGTDFESCTVATSCAFAEQGELGGEMLGQQHLAADGGKVWVADFSNNRVQRFDTNGGFERAWGRDVDSGTTDTFEVCQVRTSCRKGKLSVRGGELEGPRNVAADAAGNFYVVDEQNHRVVKYDADGTFNRTWGSGVHGGVGPEKCLLGQICTEGAQPSPTSGGEFTLPRAIAVQGSHVYVTEDHRVQRFSLNGDFELAWGRDVDSVNPSTGFEVCTAAAACQTGTNGTGAGATGGDMESASGIAADSSGLYVSDRSLKRVQKFDFGGTFQRAWGKNVDPSDMSTGFQTCTATCQAGSSGVAAGELTQPDPIAADGAGKVYVGDQGNGRISIYGSDGSFVTQLTGLFFPEGVTADAAGRYYVVTAAGYDVREFTPSGDLIREWGKAADFTAPGTGFEVCNPPHACTGGQQGSLGGEMNLPTGLGIAPDGSILVADLGNARIQSFEGDPLPPPPPPSPAPPTGDPGQTAPATGGGGGTILTPSNAFKIGKVKKLVLSVTVQSAGTVTVTDAAAKTSATKQAKPLLGKSTGKGGPGTIRVTLKLSAKAKQALRKKKLRLRAKVTFAPTGGTPNTATTTLKLKK